jgi:hypothetical protein
MKPGLMAASSYIKNRHLKPATLAHACNPSYSRDRNQEDHGLEPARANSSQECISKKKTNTHRAGGVAQGIDPEFKLQYHKKKKKTH